MLNPSRFAWRDQIVLAQDIATPGARNSFYSAVRRGDFVRICWGAYMPHQSWARLDHDHRYLFVVRASALLFTRDLVFSHFSAAALWRLPMIGRWPDRAHVVDRKATGGRSGGLLVRHIANSFEDFEGIEGLHVTSLARTVVDLSRILPFASAVAIADAALRRTSHPVAGLPPSTLTREQLLETVRQLPSRQGTAKARRVIEFADGRADRPGESLSRAGMHLMGISVPDIQAPLRGASGRAYSVDFWWPEFNIIGEFDGREKYTNPEFLAGRSSAQAVIDEKAREDDLRAAGHGMNRWLWETAISPQRLRTHLVAAGVH